LTRKLNFDIENVHLIKETSDSQFALLGMDAFSSGDNLHHLVVSEQALKDAEPSILRKPVVWSFDNSTNDIGSHDPREIPAGFIPDNSDIKYRKLEDGRTMMSLTALIWKRYSGKLLDLFARDGASKPVSVEIDVISQDEKKNEILSFVYDCITILGSFITPAIPGARAEVLRFSQEYDEDIRKEFGSKKYNDIDFKIPATIKANAQKGLDLYNETKKGGTSVALANARHLISNESVSPDKARSMFKHLNSRKNDEIDQNSDVDWCLYGGELEWVSSIVEQMNAIDERNSKATHFTGDLGSGDYSLTVDKSKDSLSDSSWGDVDKTALRNKILGAKNYKSLVEDVYMQVLAGWEDAPSEKLKYPVMSLSSDKLVYNKGGLSSALGYAKANNESGVVSKINGIYKHLGLDDDKENSKEKEVKNMASKKDKKEEIADEEKEEEKEKKDNPQEEKAETPKQEKQEEKSEKEKGDDKEDMAFTTNLQVMNLINSSLSRYAYTNGKVESPKYHLRDYDKKFTYLYDYEDEKLFSIPYSILNGEVAIDVSKRAEVVSNGYRLASDKIAKFESMSLDQNLDVSALLAFLQKETESYGDLTDKSDDDPDVEMCNTLKDCMAEIGKGKDMDANNMFGKFMSYVQKMSARMSKMATDNDVYMGKNKELMAFKKDIEDKQKEFEVATVLNEAKEAGMPSNEVDNCREEASKYSMETIDAYKNMVKAKAFTYLDQKKDSTKNKTNIIPLPFDTKKKPASNLWG
jgi:hypothetical protein